MPQEERRPGQLPIAVLQAGVGVEHHARRAERPIEVKEAGAREQLLGVLQLVDRLAMESQVTDVSEFLAIDNRQVETRRDLLRYVQELIVDEGDVVVGVARGDQAAIG